MAKGSIIWTQLRQNSRVVLMEVDPDSLRKQPSSGFPVFLATLLALTAAVAAAPVPEDSVRPALSGGVAGCLLVFFGASGLLFSMLHAAQSAACGIGVAEANEGKHAEAMTDKQRRAHHACWLAALAFQLAFGVLLVGRILSFFPEDLLIGSVVAGGAAIVLHGVLFELIARTWGLNGARGLLQWLDPFVAFFLSPFAALVGATERRSVPSAEPAQDERQLELLPYVRGVDRVVVEEAVEMIDSVREFTELTARGIMTPRTEIEGLPRNTPRDEVMQKLAHAEFSRQVVYEGTYDNILGFLMAKEVLLNKPEDPFTLLRKPIVVPHDMHLPELLRRIRQSKSNFAVVMDEYGGTAGIVTLHDLFESVIGEAIADEHEDDEPVVVAQSDGTSVVAGRAEVWEVNEALGLELDEEITRTIGGYLMHCFGRLPDVGETWAVEGGEFRVLEVENKRIQSAAFRRTTAAPETDETSVTAASSDSAEEETS